MKIKRFVAKDMRSALEQIKVELGPDAVIMSNKKIPEGVELMAAIDNNASHVAPVQVSDTPNVDSGNTNSRNIGADKVTLQYANEQNIGDGSITQALSKNTTQAPAPADSLEALLKRQVQHPASHVTTTEQHNHVPQPSLTTAQELPIEEQFKNFTQRLESGATQPEQSMRQQEQNTINRDITSSPQASTNSTPVEAAEIIQMRNEMASIRQLLEHQVAGLMWQDLAQKNPNRAVLISRLQAMGVSEVLADQLAGYISGHINEQEAWNQVLDILTEQLNTTNNDIIRHGGVVSLVGPTGVGKTTTIAKLAARFSQTHGADSVALISTDTYRIAGFEQLTTYARIIGCEAKLAKDHLELDDLIQQYAHKKLILIDTAGMGQRDMRLSQYLTSLISNARVRIRNYLVLSANTQQRVMQENVERFKKIPLAGCIYTKLDESLSFGEIITTSIQNGLPIGYLTDGQRVPEDIKVANAEKLVRLADKMANKYANPSSFSADAVSATSSVCA